MSNILDEARLEEKKYTEEHSTEVGKWGNREAHEGYVFKCGACGKTSRDRYGNKPISRGWDESCAMNSFLDKE